MNQHCAWDQKQHTSSTSPAPGQENYFKENTSANMEAYMGEIRLFSFEFTPKNWLPCEGQILSATTYATLFSILGSTYGGDGRTTFKLPDLRARTPIHSGGNVQGAPPLGEAGGSDSLALTADQIPSHNHSFRAAASPATAVSPQDALFGTPATQNMYSKEIQTVPIAATAGGGAPAVPFNHRQPYAALQYCICIVGIIPSPDDTEQDT